MFDLHHWQNKPYTEPRKETLQVITPKYWFGEGIGNELKELEVEVLGTTLVSYAEPPVRFAQVERIEYGTATYQDSTFTVIAPFPNVTENWRYLGSLPKKGESL